MTREHILMVLGGLVLISPWSGLPLAWLEWVLLVLGLAIIVIVYSMRRRDRQHPVMPPPLPPQSNEQSHRSPPIAFS